MVSFLSQNVDLVSTHGSLYVFLEKNFLSNISVNNNDNMVRFDQREW